MRRGVNLDSISIVLVRPKYPENVGSVARAMKNMGLSRLILVNGCPALHMNAYRLASGAEDILERAEELSSIEEALGEMGCVVGMTSREGKDRSPLLHPDQLARKLISLSQKNSVGLVFGSEKDGLSNEELSRCHLFVKIPSCSSFPSLNLAHAVIVVCHELFKASGPIPARSAELARSETMEKMFEHMKKTLVEIGFLNSRDQKRIMRALRNLFGRSQMDEREVRILQGIWSQVDWYTRRKADRQSHRGT